MKPTLYKTVRQRLGNQMFQIAAGRYYADILGMDFVAVVKSDEDYAKLTETKDIMFPWLKVEREAPLWVNEWKKPMRWSHAYIEIPYVPNGHSLLLGGHCEHYRYFPRDYARELFAIPPVVAQAIIRDYPDVDWDNTVSVHVRRGDKLNLQHIYPIPSEEWIRRCMAHFDGFQFLFVSDDMTWCMDHFGKDGNCIFADKMKGRNKQFVDMYLPTICAANIISNSTFCWWGAYLNVRQEQQPVLYELPWNRAEWWANPCPLEWITVE